MILLMGFEGLTLNYSGFLGYNYGYGLFYYMGTLGLICWCLARSVGITPPYQSTTLDLPLAIIVISGACALVWSRYWNDGLHVVLYTIMSYFMYLLISALNTTPRKIERLFWWFFVLGIITVVATVSTFFFGFFQSYKFSDNISFTIRIVQFVGTRISLTGTMGAAAKAIACLLNISIFCSLTLLCTQVRRSSRLLIFAALLAMLFIHFMTLSRLEAMGLFWGWLMFAYLNPKWREARMPRHLLMAASFVTMAIAVLIMFSTCFNVSELFARATGQEQTVGYRFSGTQARIDHIYFALKSIWETGGLGAGAAGIMRGLDPTIWLHSPVLYFSFLTDHGYGLLSLILMGWLIINTITELRWALQNCPDPKFKIFVIGVCSGLTTYATAGIGDHFFYLYEMWVLLGFAAAVVKGVRYLTKSPP